MLFDVNVTNDVGGVVVMSVVGELDMSTAPKLRQQLLGVIADASDRPLIVLDLAGVDLLDATGLGVVLDGVKRVRLRGGDLALARAEPQVRRDLEITRVIEILPVHESVAEAIASLGD